MLFEQKFMDQYFNWETYEWNLPAAGTYKSKIEYYNETMWNETTEEEYVVEMSYYRYWQGDTMDDMLQIIKDELRIPTPLVEVEDQFEFGL